MRLLRREDGGGFCLIQFSESHVPKYAILSHTWSSEDGEVTFDDLMKGTAHLKAESFDKIRFCVEQAAKDDLEYCWVDTCCINKSSSAELQEAITTMFSWYRNASRCYVYLSDVTTTQNLLWESEFRKSRWFTRGWTLQELLAPASVEFFSAHGIRLGDKKSLEAIIYKVTGIPHQALCGADMADFSVTERLSWAEHRQTQRKEDKAYSLLGIFGIFMPLIYGEGGNAFTRLQEELRKKHADVAKQNEELLARLPVVPQAAFNSLENQHESTCTPGTRVELLREITEWAGGSDKSCIFWLNGIAGTGKSTIAHTVARTFHDQGCLGASFFFSRGGGDVSCADRLFTTLAWQLAAKMPRLREYIAEAIMQQENIMNQSLRDQWDHLIFNPLSKLNGNTSLSTIVVVMDALDECNSERDIRIILRLLASTQALKNIRLRVFVTSRPEIPIRCSFYQIQEAQRQIFVLHDIQPEIVDHDLGIFFEDSFTTIREERGFAKTWPGTQIVRRLVEVSGGLFIWAATACRFIREGRRLATKRISNLLVGQHFSAGPEKKLDEIYTTVLRGCVWADYDVDEKKEVYRMLREVLGSIIILFSPLSIESLSHLLPLSSSEINETLMDCHAILNIPDQTHRPIRPHHPTFRDFLLNKNRCYDVSFWVDEKAAHKAMADNCVRLMNKELRRDICGLQVPGTLTKDIDPDLVKKRISPELEYAGRYWVQHYHESGTTPYDGNPSDHFIKNFLLHWLELMSLTGHMSEVAGTLRMYEALLVVSGLPTGYT
ncbi:vegetative incompatibility protein HET-E-1 [Colletotrichum tofieldiae]|nr:vegetative incompatibility protein HET-E-1 [Colletotrichum tofieldiae]